MPDISRIFDCGLAAQSIEQAQTVAELENAWAAVQQDFQEKWERKGHHVLFLIHDDFSWISDDDVATLLGQIAQLDKHKPIDFILHTQGGEASATHQIANRIVSRPSTTSFVPFFAKSGGTLVALATQRVHIGKAAVLGPVDLQIGNWGSARNLVKLVNEMGDKAPANMRLVAGEAEKALKDEAKKICAVINRRHKGWFGWRGCSLAEMLTAGEMFHGDSITYNDAKKMHVQVRPTIPQSAYGLISVRLAQLRRLRELEAQINLVQRQAAKSDAA